MTEVRQTEIQIRHWERILTREEIDALRVTCESAYDRYARAGDKGPEAVRRAGTLSTLAFELAQAQKRLDAAEAQPAHGEELHRAVEREVRTQVFVSRDGHEYEVPSEHEATVLAIYCRVCGEPKVMRGIAMMVNQIAGCCPTCATPWDDES